MLHPFIHSPGWPYHRFPNPCFKLNTSSLQSHGLIAWWPTLAVAGTNNLKDLVSNISGSLQGTAAIVSDPRRGAALTLDGNSDFWLGPDDARLEGTPFSIAFWAKWDGIRYAGAFDWMSPVSKGDWNADEYALMVSRVQGAGNNTIGFWINGGLRASFVLTPLDTNWHQYLMSYDQINAKIFFDGIERGSGAYAVPVAGTADVFRIGYSRGGKSYYWGGEIDDVRYASVAHASALAHHFYAKPWDLYDLPPYPFPPFISANIPSTFTRHTSLTGVSATLST